MGVYRQSGNICGFPEASPAVLFWQNNRGWKADFEYLLRESTLDKVLEGNL
ncbi:Uncharacterised protein [Rodentibacter pneumotropicus]|uniref:Uncharacterized protein n=1 Tax=Rodentibacter pneumotropicus TaxID=758 RepID=A0A448MQ96_9PAST|nr:Uncharacterised protein [Rodentibacter pneumotropicus]